MQKSWKSPLSADVALNTSSTLIDFCVDGDDIYMAELRPNEGGRFAIVQIDSDGKKTTLLYGGASFLVRNQHLVFTHSPDQRAYHCPVNNPVPIPLTEESARALRYADYDISKDDVIVCVREDHRGEKVENCIVELPSQRVIARGADFYSNPRISPDGKRVCWLQWNHPSMPWDFVELWVGNLDGSAQRRTVSQSEQQALYGPEWSPTGELYFISDSTGYWNLFRLAADDCIIPVYTPAADMCGPLWQFGFPAFAFVPDSPYILCTHSAKLLKLDVRSGIAEELAQFSQLTWISGRPGGRYASFHAGSSLHPAHIFRVDLSTFSVTPAVPLPPLLIPVEDVSETVEMTFPTADGKDTARMLYYPPKNHNYQLTAPPPLLVKSHGGPTAATDNFLDYMIQFWTTRGFAVADVLYRGSTGYGREYRRKLNKAWGDVDMVDCTFAAKYLCKKGLADAARVAIDGYSAGGLTTLNALIHHPEVFRVGCSQYGVTDMEMLVQDTHKFEERYLDSVVGVYPQERAVYLERSPLQHAAKLTRPCIFVQGGADPIVLPNQPLAMVQILKERGIPVAYLEFEGEHHGFVKAENRKRALEAELYFFLKIFGMDSSDDIEPVPIDNL